MPKESKFKVGDLVIHSGSHYRGETTDSKKWGIIMECSSPQIELGKWRSILVHWFGDEEQRWTAPRNLYALDEALKEVEDGIKWEIPTAEPTLEREVA